MSKMSSLFLRKYLLAALLAGAGCQGASAEEVEAWFLVAQLASGASESVMLSNDANAVGPRLLNHEGIVVINGQRYASSQISGLRIEKRMVDGIEALTEDMTSEGNSNLSGRRNGVFDLSGRQVDDGLSGSQHLQKGIYIVNGKKVVVK